MVTIYRFWRIMSGLFLVILLLVVGSVVTLGVARWRWIAAGWIGVATSLIALVMWLIGSGSVPGSMTLLAWGPNLAWQWQIDAENWQVGLFFLLLTLMAAWTVVWTEQGMTWHPAGLLLLATATGLIAIGGGSLAGIAAGWAVLSGGWWLLWGNPAGSLKRLGILWLGILFVMLALASLPSAELGNSLNMSQWPTLSATWILLAAIAQLGLFQPLAASYQPPATSHQLPATIGSLLPAGAGALLLIKLVETNDVGLGFALPVTLLGLVGFVWAIQSAWSAQDKPGRVAQALILGQTNLVLLVGVWAGGSAAFAETQLLLLAGGILLVGHYLRGRTRLVLAMPLLALAGLPFTAGFAGRTALYNAWLDNGQFVLVFVLALLHIPFVWVMARQIVSSALSERLERRHWLLLVGLVFPVLGLISLNGLGEAKILSWVMVLLPAGVAIALSWFMRHLTFEALQHAFQPPPIVKEAWQSVRNSFTVVATAIREAATILEGEGGMVWLLIILVVFWLARA